MKQLKALTRNQKILLDKLMRGQRIRYEQHNLDHIRLLKEGCDQANGFLVYPVEVP